MTNNEIQNCCIATIMQWKKYHLHHCHPHLLHQEVQPLLSHPVMKTKSKKNGWSVSTHYTFGSFSFVSEKWLRPPETIFLESGGGMVVRAIASHQCGLGSISRLGVTCGLSLLVLFSALRGFSLGTPVFPSPQKTCISFNMIWLIWFVHMTPQASSFETHHV